MSGLENEASAPIRGVPLWRRLVIGRNPRRTLVRVLVLVCLSWVVFRWVLLPLRVSGMSMEPAYRDGAIRFVNRLAYAMGTAERGDVIAIQTTGRTVVFMKRVIGLPGESIRIRQGTVYINGEALAEPYVRYRNRERPWQLDEIQLAKDEFFVIGDNRGMEQQLHEFGQIARWRVLGKVLF